MCAKILILSYISEYLVSAIEKKLWIWNEINLSVFLVENHEQALDLSNVSNLSIT